MFSTIISAEDLQKLLTTELKDEVTIFDCRHRLDNPDKGHELYQEGHIPGAIFVHLDKDLAGPIGMTESGHSGRHPLPDPDVWMKRLGEWGVEPSKQVIAYDDSGGSYAARLWWMLRAIGHEAVAVLNGGLQAWVASGGQLETRETKPKPVQFPYRGRFRSDWVADLDEVKSQIANRNPVLSGAEGSQFLLVDARAPNRYRGETETLDPIAGHIPGARNMYYQENLNPDGTFRSHDELRARFEPIVQQAKGREIAMYCGSGVSACHNLLAMEIAGLPPARLFPNSWSGWSNTPGLPVAKGAE